MTTNPAFSLRFYVLLLTASLACTGKVNGQTAEDIHEQYFKDWYQVEVIIFERIEAGAADAERWPTNIALQYPNRIQRLLSTAEAKAVRAKRLEERLSLELSTQDSAQNRELLEQLRNTPQQDPYYDKLIDSIESAEKLRSTPTEVPFVNLGGNLRQLNDEARRMGRSRDMRVLFHAAWRQPMLSQKDAAAVLTLGGDTFGDHQELEGALTFYLSRYLHVHSNLWLTEFEANFGQETLHWPWLPAIPNRQESLENTSAPLSIDEIANTQSTSQFQGFDLELDSQYTDLAAQPYVVRHIVTMKQKRRMRSGELHYLDHPRLGLLIRIDRYKPNFESATETDSETEGV